MTPREERMLRSLPVEYWENPFVARMVAASAAEFDRMHALIDKIIVGMVPGAAEDYELGFLSHWEQRLNLPVRPDGVSTSARQTAVRVKFRALNVKSAADVLAMMADVVGDVVDVARNSPSDLHDEVVAPVTSDSYEAGRLRQVVADVWPAHRAPTITFSD